MLSGRRNRDIVLIRDLALPRGTHRRVLLSGIESTYGSRPDAQPKSGFREQLTAYTGSALHLGK
jgi:hypothetical protein